MYDIWCYTNRYIIEGNDIQYHDTYLPSPSSGCTETPGSQSTAVLKAAVEKFNSKDRVQGKKYDIWC